MAKQLRELERALRRDMAGIALEGEVSMQLMTNVLFAYTLETFFGGAGYSVLNTSLRNLVESVSRIPGHSVAGGCIRAELETFLDERPGLDDRLNAAIGAGDTLREILPD